MVTPLGAKGSGRSFTPTPSPSPTVHHARGGAGLHPDTYEHDRHLTRVGMNPNDTHVLDFDDRLAQRDRIDDHAGLNRWTAA